MQGRVGVLLDEFPGDMRETAAALVLEQSDDLWRIRAQRQLRLSKLRLNFRDFRYEEKGQLPLPPVELWSIQLDPAGATRQTVQGHDLILIDYTFTSVLLTGADSAGQAEPALGAIGGVWLEPFIFPLDPDLLLQRTGNACINEGGFPPNSFDSENIWNFYDFACQADSGGASGCHRTLLPARSCRQALAAGVGEHETSIRFERLPWDEVLAGQVRLGPFPSAGSPDLLAVAADLETNRIVYRFIDPDNCAVEEASVGGSGWRRLLQFSATVHNVGGQPLHIGPVLAEDLEHNVFDYSLCHDHFHYSHYGDFSLAMPDQLVSGKQAFCVQSTDRYSNNELAPLTHDYSCRFQGIQTGWVDEYGAGLDSQWLDITDLAIPAEGVTVQLGFTSNSDQFLCEGTPILDERGEVVWEATGFVTEDGAAISRPNCEFTPDWDANNQAFREVFIPQTGGFVTAPCTKNELSPLRNCGFTELPVENAACAPGDLVDLALPAKALVQPQILRVCEWSAQLGSGVACTFEDAVANLIVGRDENRVTFACPQVRDAEEFAGGYALYMSPVYPAGSSPSE
jgi:hypothetical protein